MKAFASLALLATLGAVASAQTLFSSNFDSPTYTAGATVIGQDGWTQGSGSGAGYQTVTTSASFSGGQSLGFTQGGTATSFYSARKSFASTAGTAYTATTKIQIASSTVNTRLYGLYFSAGTLGTTYLGATIAGDGGIRVGKAWSDTYKTTADVTAAAGTFADRWLDLTLSLDGAGGGTIAFSGFSDASTYTFNFTGVTNTTGTKYLNVGTDYISGAPTGTAYFDNITLSGSSPVPEPATMAGLALGGLALLRRRKSA